MQHYLISTPQEIEELKSYVKENDFKTIVLDLETDSVVEVIANPYGIGIAFQPDEAFYIPIRYESGVRVWKDSEELEIIQWLYSLASTKDLVGHNIIYDVLVLRHHYGIDFIPFIYSDTILLKHMIDEEMPHGLKETAVKYLGAWADQAQKDMYDSIVKNGGSITKTNLQMFKADTDILGKYCAWDCMLTFKLYNLFSKKLKEEDLEKLFYEDEVMPLYKEVTIPMKFNGVSVDEAHFKDVKVKLEAKLEELETKLYTEIKELVEPFELQFLEETFPEKRTGNFPKTVANMIGLEITSLSKKAISRIAPSNFKQIAFIDWMQGGPVPPVDKVLVQRKMFSDKFPDRKYVFNFKSKDHLKHLFIEVLGEQSLSETEGGEPKMDDEFLTEMVKRYPWASILRDINTLNKIQGTYIDGLLEKVVNGKLYTSFLQFGTTSGRFASRAPNCQNWPAHQKTDDKDIDYFVNSIRHGMVSRKGYKLIGSDFCLSPDTDILTPGGWKNIMSVTLDDEVWQVNPTSLVGSWCHPSRVINKEYKGKMYSFGNRRGRLKVTENHTMLWAGQFHKTRADKVSYRQVNLSQDLIPREGLNILFGSEVSDSYSNFSERDIWISCMLAADGWYNKQKDSYRVQVSKDRKIKKVTELLGPGNLSDHVRDCHTLPVCSWNYIKYKSPLLSGKDLNVDLVGSNQVGLFLEALSFWDGSMMTDRKFHWGSVNKDQVEKVQALAVRHGYEARMNIRYHNNPNHNTYYSLQIKKLARMRVRRQDYLIEEFEGRVGCVTVPEGFILVRREGQTFVTGNCSLEPHIAAYVSGDKDLIDIFVTGKDFYSAVAIRQFKLEGLSAFKEDKNYLGDVDKALRSVCKTYTLAAFYGATAPRISQVLGCPKEEAEELLNGYLDAYPGIKEFIETSHKEATRKGFVKTMFGRVRHLTEAKLLYNSYGNDLVDYVWAARRGLLDERKKYRNLLNNSINFKIQGAAGHVLNRAMLKTQRMFNTEGIDGQIVLTIHDELIAEVVEHQVQRAKEIIKYCMETAVDISPIKLKATPIIGNSYGECK